MRFWKTKKQKAEEAARAMEQAVWNNWQSSQETVWRLVDKMGPSQRRIPLEQACRQNDAMWEWDPKEWLRRTHHWPTHWRATSPDVWRAAQR